MSTHNKHFIIKQEKFSKISINICFLGYQGTKKQVRISHGKRAIIVQVIEV